MKVVVAFHAQVPSNALRREVYQCRVMHPRTHYNPTTRVFRSIHSAGSKLPSRVLAGWAGLILLGISVRRIGLDDETALNVLEAAAHPLTKETP